MIRYKSFRDMLENQDGNNVALEFFNGTQRCQLSYQQLLEKMADYPLPKQQVVGILCDGQVDTVIAILALASRRQLVMLGADDNIDQLKEQIRATSVQTLIGNEELKEQLSDSLCLESTVMDNDILFFTSGTTYSSKAVVLSEQSLINATYNGGSLLPLKAEDRLLNVLPVSHVFGLVCSLLWPLSFGATVCLSRGLTSFFFDFDVYKPTAVTLVPQMAGFLAARRMFNQELKLVLIGAGDCPQEVLQLISSQGIRVSFGYGLTESSSGIALSLGDEPKAMTICPDYEVRIAEDGEIMVHSSTTLMKGYYKDPQRTAEVLADNWLKTGDLGRLDEAGRLHITGRKKEILVCRDGTKIFLPEYEARLQKLLGLEADFAVIQDKDARIVLYIHTNDPVEQKIDQFNETLPRGNRIAYVFYGAKALPRTKTNKVKRYLLKIQEED